MLEPVILLAGLAQGPACTATREAAPVEVDCAMEIKYNAESEEGEFGVFEVRFGREKLDFA